MHIDSVIGAVPRDLNNLTSGDGDIPLHRLAGANVEHMPAGQQHCFFPSCLKDYEVALCPVETNSSARGDHVHVLDARSELASDEYARLDGEGHTGFKGSLVDHVQVRRLVHILADRMAQAVTEMFAEACIGDDPPSNSIDVARACAWAHRLCPRGL